MKLARPADDEAFMDPAGCHLDSLGQLLFSG